MLKSKLGILYYLFARNDKVWQKLSDKERNFILRENFLFNNKREGYRNPENYGKIRFGGGENWDSVVKRTSFKKITK